MNNLIITLIVLCISFCAYAQNEIVICGTSPVETFACFAFDKEFVAQHPYPKKYTHISRAGGKMVTFDCPDNTKGKGYLILSKQPTANWIFVFQEWWGLNDNIKKWAEDLYNEVEGTNILALDMYDGKLTENRETAAQYMKAFRKKRGNMIIKGALAYVGKKARIGTIGWCFGGGLSLQAALVVGKQAVGCVMYYGMPEKNVDRLKQLNTDVLNIWPTRDKWINKEVMDSFKKTMTLAGKKLIVHSYDADHAFANPSNPIFDKKSYEDARAKTITYFKAKMK